MNLRPLLILLPLALAGCPKDGSTSSSTASATPAVAAQAHPVIDALLAGYRWTLETATDASGKRIDALFPAGGKGLALAFADGNANVSGGCNRMGGRYVLDAGNTLTVANLRSTMMACEPALM